MWVMHHPWLDVVPTRFVHTLVEIVLPFTKFRFPPPHGHNPDAFLAIKPWKLTVARLHMPSEDCMVRPRQTYLYITTV